MTLTDLNRADKIFRRVLQVFSAYSVINNYLLKCFKIERTKLAIRTGTINTSTILIFYRMSDEWVVGWMGE